MYFCTLSMRILFFILSFYLMTLNLVSCSDYENYPVTKAVAAYTHDHSAHNEHSKQDACSPFCYCQCCQITVAQHDYLFSYISEDLFNENYKKIDHLYVLNFPTELFGTIFQPPKI